MSLLERSKKIAQQQVEKTAAAVPNPRKSLRERAQEILQRATAALQPKGGTSAKSKAGRRPSLRERALAFLRGELAIKTAPSEKGKAHKGLLARAKELLGLMKGDTEEEKKNTTILQDSLPEQSDIELAAPPQVTDAPLEHIHTEDETKEDETKSPVLDPTLTEKIGEFFDKLALALQKLNSTLKYYPAEKAGELKEVAQPKEEKISPVSLFFKDEETAKPPFKSTLHPVAADFLPQEGFFVAEKDLKGTPLTPDPQIIFPAKRTVEQRLVEEPWPLRLTYRLGDIIPPGSPYEFHSRSLSNAGYYLEQGQFREAIQILERVISRIPDDNIRRKIMQDIRDIEEYLQKEEERLRSLPMNLPGVSGSLQTPETIEQRIEKAQFNIENAGLQAENIQIMTPSSLPLATTSVSASAAVSPAAGSVVENLTTVVAGQGATPKAVTVSAAGTPATAATTEQPITTPATGEANESAPSSGESISSPQLVTPPLAAPSSEENSSLPPLPPEEMGQGVLAQPAVPPLATAGEGFEEVDLPETEKKEEEKAPVQEIRGVLELKQPDQEDTPFLTLTYDFTKIPYQFVLSRDHQIFEYAYYKYKPMLLKAQKYLKRKQITKALNYYRVIREQQIPPEFRRMIDRNIKDITEYLQKYLMARQ